MPKLSYEEELMSESELIYKWLREGKVSCERVVGEYAKVLRDERDAYVYEATSYTYPLYLYTNKGVLKKGYEWVKDKAIGMMYTFNNQRTGIKWKEEYEEYVKKHKLNTDRESIQYLIYEEGKKK